MDFLDRHLKDTPQRPIFTNFGEPIDLTRKQTISVATSEKFSSEICPYKGLEFFTEEDHEYFYGRTELTDQLLDRVRQVDFLAVLGASGSGKSSLLRAGLLHQLKQGQRISESDRWAFHILQPGEHPLESLAIAFLDPELSNIERATQLQQAKSLIQQGSKGLQNLVQATSASRVVLIIDQFEEAFTLCQNSTEREQFFECILGAINSPLIPPPAAPPLEREVRSKTVSKLCVILAMRADFFGKCVEAEYSGLAKRIQDSQEIVTPMTSEQLREAIAQPANQVGLEVEPELIEQMLKDVQGSPGSLPLLQYTLKTLWEIDKNCLQLSAYQQLGGVGGTLDKRATEVYERLNPTEKATARHIFLSLTQLGEGTEDTRRRVRKQDLMTAHSEELVDQVVQKLANEKLIVTSDRRITSDKVDSNSLPGSEIVDVAHEALIRHWVLLRKWLNESRDHLRKKRQIEAAAEDWCQHKKAKDYLLQGKRLREAKEFHREKADQFPLSTEAEKFIQASVRSRRNNRIKSTGLFLIIPLIGTTVSGFFIWREWTFSHYRNIIDEDRGKEYSSRRIAALENLNRADRKLGNIDLSGAKLRDAKLRGAKLRGANLSEADLGNAELRGADLVMAKLRGANLIAADLIMAYLPAADLIMANLSVANLRGANLRKANLSEADLIIANLTGADLTGANLTGADLTGANLSEAKLWGTYLRDTDFRMDVDGEKVKNLTPKQIKLACYWEYAKFDEDFQKELESFPDPETPPDCSFWE